MGLRVSPHSSCSPHSANWPSTASTSGAGPLTSVGTAPGPHGEALGLFHCSAPPPGTAGLHGASWGLCARCPAGWPAWSWRTPWAGGCCSRGQFGCCRSCCCHHCCRGRPGWWRSGGGQRAKLLACDGNEIDAMFIDRRQRPGPHGSTLVICCEGNAGFYEVGCLCTPLEAGYSVLGWNHPGFGGSTGVPLPQSEANAMDVVVRFALQELQFPPHSIVLYAWSIGGFTATWAAMSYPELGALVLDASFDDLVPLALKVLPRSWGELVTRTVREHLNLNNAEQLCRYQGPVLLVRRTRDEIITTTVPDDIASNRGNDLLLKLLQHRYPKIMADEGTRIVREWLETATPAEERALAQRCPVDERWCLELLEAFAGDRDPQFPWSLGEELSGEERQQLALFLAQKHLQNFEASHCTPLPPQAFRLPWSL
uniref:AB hydrolase-1 domain-containing protein n=1 Tax=Melopsittacus undulatus TaxID=13146 RepID=A0A8V5H0Z6_MELUD